MAEYELAEKMQRRLIKLEMKRYGAADISFNFILTMLVIVVYRCVGEQNQMVSDSLLKLGGLLKEQNELEQAAAVYQVC